MSLFNLINILENGATFVGLVALRQPAIDLPARLSASSQSEKDSMAQNQFSQFHNIHDMVTLLVEFQSNMLKTYGRLSLPAAASGNTSYPVAPELNHTDPGKTFVS